MQNLKTIFFNLLLFCITSLLFLLLLEGISRVFFKFEYTSAAAFIKSRPKPYANSDFFSEAFLIESEKPDSGIFNPKGTRLLYPKDSRGVYYNVKEHLRVTTDQPDYFLNKIYLFGGSTIYNAEVPDKYTIASNLQRLYNKSYPNKYKVINCGVSSVNTLQELERLKTLQILKGDIVIFYGGVNDALLFSTGRIDGWILGENDKEYANFNLFQKLRFKLYMKFHDKSFFISKFLFPFSSDLPPHMKDKIQIAILQEKLGNSYTNAVSIADSICQANKALFINFVQPNLITRVPNTQYEIELLHNKYLVSPHNLEAVKLSYIALLKANKTLNDCGIKSIDLTGIFNKTVEDYYLDYCHVTDKANSIIAAQIYQSLNN